VGDQYDNVVSHAFKQAQENAARIKSNLILDAIIEGDLTSLMGLDLDELDPDQMQDLIMDSVAPELTKTMDSLKNGVDLGSVGRRAIVTVETAGVLQYKSVERKLPSCDKLLDQSTQLKQDEVIEGKIIELNTRPRLGGTLMIQAGLFSTLHIHGLVNPATGKPRAKLEIFGD